MISEFRYFGGVPQEILFDNMKTVVDMSKSTFSNIEFNNLRKAYDENRLEARLKHYIYFS